MKKFFYWLVPLVFVALPACTLTERSAPRAVHLGELPGLKADGFTLLPNQWLLHPAGRQIPMGDFPVNIAVHPGGRQAYTWISALPDVLMTAVAFGLVLAVVRAKARPGRMPLVLSDADLEAWLGDQPLPPDELQRLCAGLPPDALLFEERPAPLKMSRPAKPSDNEGPMLL